MKKPGERRIGLILGFEAEVRLAANDDDVAPLRFTRDQLSGIANFLEDFGSDAACGGPAFEILEETKNTAMGVHQAGFVAASLEGSASKRDRFWPVDRRRGENAEPKQAGLGSSCPVDRERARAVAVRRAIEGDERRSEPG